MRGAREAVQTRARQRSWGWGRVYPRKVPQCPTPFQLETFPQCPCLVLRRAACPEGGLLSPSAIFLRVSSAAHGQPLSSRDGRGLRLQPPVSSWTQSRNFRRICSQVRSRELGWLCPTVSLPACLYQRAGSFASHLREASGPAAPHVARCIHPMPVAAPAQSGCFRGGPWRPFSLGRRTWCTKGAPLSEAGVLRLRPSGPVRRPVSRIPSSASRSSRSPTAA